MTVAHPDQPLAPHDIWSAWSVDPLIIGCFVVAIWLYRRGRIRRTRLELHRWRSRCFAGALVALGVALLSPLDALSSALASAHMVQHLLLVLVAAPLLAFSAPSSALLRGSPFAVRRASSRLRRRFRVLRSSARVLRRPATVWLVYVGTLWLWHSAVAYDAALAYEPVHIMEHASLLVSGVLLWRVLVGSRSDGVASPGFRILLVFATALQSGFLALLLTFAQSPWYSAYATTTAAWHLDPLADQQLAGVIMWIPGGFVYLATALTLLVLWIQRTAGAVRAPNLPPKAYQVEAVIVPPSRSRAADLVPRTGSARAKQARPSDG